MLIGCSPAGDARSLNPYGERTLARMHRGRWLAHTATRAGVRIYHFRIFFQLCIFGCLLIPYLQFPIQVCFTASSTFGAGSLCFSNDREPWPLSFTSPRSRGIIKRYTVPQVKDRLICTSLSRHTDTYTYLYCRGRMKMQVRKKQVQMCKDGKCKYGKMKYDWAEVEM